MGMRELREKFENTSTYVFHHMKYYTKNTAKLSHQESVDYLFETNNKMLSYNEGLLKKKLGKSAFTVKDSSNRLLKVWCISSCSGDLYIIGTKGRGVSVETTYTTDTLSNYKVTWNLLCDIFDVNPSYKYKV